MRRLAALVTASLIAAACIAGLPLSPAAQAATYPPGATGQSNADVLGLDVNLLRVPIVIPNGVTLADVALGHAESALDSSASPAASAASRNLGLAVAGLSLPVDGSSQSAPPDNAAPSSATLAAVGTELLDVGVLETSAHARWADACVANGQSATAQTQLAGALLQLLGLDVVELGASTVTTDTTVGADGMRSVATGAVADLTLLGDIDVSVSEPATLTAVATGQAGTASTQYEAPAVTVSVGGATPVALQPGADLVLLVGLGTMLNATVTLSLGDETATVAADGTSASTAVSLLDVDIALETLAGVNAGTVALDVLPLFATAGAPIGAPAQLCIDDPAVVAPADGASIANPTPAITGTGEPGASIAVSIDDAPVGSTTVAADGTWSLEVTEPLAEGPHAVVALQTIAGTSSSDTATFVVDASAPAAPALLAPIDGSSTANPTPTVTGTGEPGATVTVLFDGVESGTTTVGPDGTWTYTLDVPLADGEHTVSVRQTDAAGNASAAVERAFTVDTTALAPVIAAPADGSVTADTTPTVSGTGESGATVTVSIDGVVVGTAPVSETGTWSLDLTDALAEGPHTVSATQEDVLGNGSSATDHAFVVDLTAPAAPVIEQPVDGSIIGTPTPTVSGTAEPGATVTVAIDGELAGTVVVGDDGSWSLELSEELAEGDHLIEAAQEDAAGNGSDSAAVDVTVDTTVEPPVITSPLDGEVSNDATPIVAGTGEPEATVTVVVDGRPVGAVLVDEDGSWSFELEQPLTDGEHTIVASQQDLAGNASTEARASITVDTTVPAAVVIVSPGEGESVDDSTPVVEGTGEPGATVIVTVDGTLAGMATVDDDGRWSVEVTAALGAGAHSVTVTQVDAAGNTSAPASVTFDVVAIVAPAPQPGPGDAGAGDGESLLRTGGDVPVVALLLGLLMVISGAGLTRVRRRSV